VCVCIFASVIRHALYYHLWPVWLYQIFGGWRGRGDIVEYKMCILIRSAALSKTFLILIRIQRVTVTNVHSSSCTATLTVILATFEWDMEFLDNFRIVLKYKMFSKSIHWELSCSMPADRKTDRQVDRHDESIILNLFTDMTRLIFASRNFANSPRNEQ